MKYWLLGIAALAIVATSFATMQPAAAWTSKTDHYGCQNCVGSDDDLGEPAAPSPTR